MENVRDKLAIITGAGTGIGRELALQIVRAGGHVAFCDVFEDTLAATRAACEAAAPSGVRVSAHRCDVSDEAQVLAFRDAALAAHGRDHVELLFNNAGVSGGGSFVKDPRETWDRTFNVCWFGVYYCTRAFLPALIASPEACIINTSSINGIFAVDRSGPHTAYCSAKFAVKGFSEALLTDLRVNAPHVSLVLVMPGHIGTPIFANSLRSQGIKQPKDMADAELGTLRAWFKRRGIPDEGLTDQQVREAAQAQVDAFHDNAPVSAAQAAEQMIAAVIEKRWRLLIGDDARFLDKMAREHAEELYDPAFLVSMREQIPRKPKG
jgi:NAD(P)-dependent dehydrogenase (short-subunit alcohol dehydrogenase family)